MTTLCDELLKQTAVWARENDLPFPNGRLEKRKPRQLTANEAIAIQKFTYLTEQGCPPAETTLAIRRNDLYKHPGISYKMHTELLEDAKAVSKKYNLTVDEVIETMATMTIDRAFLEMSARGYDISEPLKNPKEFNKELIEVISHTPFLTAEEAVQYEDNLYANRKRVHDVYRAHKKLNQQIEQEVLEPILTAYRIELMNASSHEAYLSQPLPSIEDDELYKNLVKYSLELVQNLLTTEELNFIYDKTDMFMGKVIHWSESLNYFLRAQFIQQEKKGDLSKNPSLEQAFNQFKQYCTEIL